MDFCHKLTEYETKSDVLLLLMDGREHRMCDIDSWQFVYVMRVDLLLLQSILGQLKKLTYFFRQPSGTYLVTVVNLCGYCYSVRGNAAA